MSKELVVRDGEVLTLLSGGLVEISKVMGTTIYVNKGGQFAAEVEGIPIKEATLKAAEAAVKAAHTTAKRRKKLKKAIPVFGVYRNNSGRKVGHDLFFTGISATNGEVMFRKPDGSNHSFKDVVLFRQDHPERVELVRLLRERGRLEDELKEVCAALDEKLEAQNEVMYGHLLKPRGAGRWNSYRLPSFSRDPVKALERTETIISNLEKAP